MALSGAKKIKQYSQTLTMERKKVDPVEKEKLISKYAPLVKTIASRMALRLPQHIGQDDLTSAGLMGLLDAIDKFDAQKGVEFKSYAEFRIKGAMIDELRSMDWVPRSVRKNTKILEAAYTKVENREMRPARDEEVAEEMGIEMDEFYRFLDDARGISMINEFDIANQSAKYAGIHGFMNYFDMDSNPITSLNNAEVVQVIAEAVDRLSKNERTVVSLYYYEELTMKEIGEIMGYTESRVSQLHTRAVMRLRIRLKKYFD